jgi:hypothetical protein
MNSSSVEKISEKLDYYLEHPEEEAPFPFTHRVEIERLLAQRSQRGEDSSETSSLSSWSVEDVTQLSHEKSYLVDGNLLLTARLFDKLLAGNIEAATLKLYFERTIVEIPCSTPEETKQLLEKIYDHLTST